MSQLRYLCKKFSTMSMQKRVKAFIVYNTHNLKYCKHLLRARVAIALERAPRIIHATSSYCIVDIVGHVR